MATALLDDDATTARASLYVGSGGTLDDSGTVTIDEGSGGIEVGGSFRLTSTGALDSTYYQNTALTVDPGGSAELDGTWIGEYGGRIENEGTVQIDGSSLSNLAVISNAGTVCFAYNGTVNLSGLTLSGGTYEISASTTATINSNMTLDGTYLQVDYGGDLEVNAALAITDGGGIENYGTVNINSGSAVTADGTSSIYVYAEAVMNVTGSLTSSGTTCNYGTLNAGGSVTVQSASGWFYQAAQMSMNGSMLVGAGSSVEVAGNLHVGNSGTAINWGALTVDASGTMDVDGSLIDYGNGYVANYGNEALNGVAQPKSGPNDNLTVTFSESVVYAGVTGDAANGNANPGNPVANSTLYAQVTATVSDPALECHVAFRIVGNSAEVSLTADPPVDGVITLRVYGQAATPISQPKGDVDIDAIDTTNGDAFLSELRVIVVVPKSLAEKPGELNQQKAVPVTGHNAVLDATTTPSWFVDVTDPNNAAKSGQSPTTNNQAWYVTLYTVTLDILVLDQWGNPLNQVYQGQPVDEYVWGDWRTINQPLQFQDGGCYYQDPVGYAVGRPQNPYEPDDANSGPNSAAAQTWDNAAPTPLPTNFSSASNQLFAVSIAGLRVPGVDPGQPGYAISRRLVRVTAPNSIVVWWASPPN